MKRLLALAICVAAPVFAAPLIPYERFTLPNGLRVIVHEDRKAPIVAVRVAYHVGGKNEPAGKTGFAHLFEHLMFKGSKNFKGDFALTLDNFGAADVNAETTQDTTQYFETVPTPALEMALWLESDRMGHFVDSINNEMLKTEIGVVQNEKRDREGGPLGLMNGLVMSSLFPESHPYRRSVIGSMDDLSAASVEDVQDWFRKYYGATNTVVVLAGDIDVKTARTLMEKYFGDAPPGEPLNRMHAWVPELASNVLESMEARVSQSGISRYWPAPSPDTRDYTLLSLAASMLGGTLRDRLHGELVERQKIATGTSAVLQPYEIASVFSIGAGVKPGANVARIEREIDAQLALFLQKGPTAKELQRIKNDLEAFQLLGLQSVSSKAQILAAAELHAGDPAFNERATQWVQQASADDIRRVANQWLGKPYYQLTIHPFGDHQVAAAKFDRSVMPAVGDDLDLHLPPIQEATLSNGMKVVFAERHEVPSVVMTMIFANAGSDADQDVRPGTASTTYSLMNTGPLRLSKVDYFERLDELHASIGMASGGRDASSSLSVLKKNLRPSLELWERALRDPAFRQTDLDDWRSNTLQSIASARIDPGAIGSRMLSKALYPADHPHAPRNDEEELVRALTIDDLKAFHAVRIRPDALKLFVVGDSTLPQIVRELERVFADWQAPASPAVAVPAIPAAPVATQPRFILIDWPEEQQVRISVGRFVLSAGEEDSRILNAANDVLGGGMTARLSQRLRVAKGWTYGIGSSADGGILQQYWGINTSVQSDKAAESVEQIIDVVSSLTGPKPVTEAELGSFIKSQSRSLPGVFEDARSVLGTMIQSDAYGRPYNWVEGASKRLHALSLENVNRVAKEYFTPQSFTWVLVGDLSKFEQKLRHSKLGSVEVWDRNGDKLR